MIRVAIVTGSMRPGRNNEAVARWVYDIAKKRRDAECELVDIADYHLPLLDEAVPPSMGQYRQRLGHLDGRRRRMLMTLLQVARQQVG
jgi:NAD(P)H-dependent FMN reductase